MNTTTNPGQRAARCECYNGHASSSGRCQHRPATDPTATRPNDAVFCDECRRDCAPGLAAQRAARDNRERIGA